MKPSRDFNNNHSYSKSHQHAIDRGHRIQLLVVITLMLLLFQFAYLKTNTSSNASTTWPKISQSSEKFIRYTCATTRSGEVGTCGGWGDRLKGMLSTYALSLILGRKFLMEITHPCEILTVFKPNQVIWNDDSGLEMVKLGSEFKERTYRCFWGHTYDTSLLEYLEANDIFKDWEQYDLITIQTAYMFTNNLAKNPFLQSRIEELGYNASRFKFHNLFYDFYHKLFKLNDRLERKYQEIKRKLKPTSESKLICAQIRVGGGIDHNTFSYPHHVKQFWDNVDRYLQRNNINSNYMIYVTSDKERIEKAAKEYFGQDKVLTIDNNFINIDMEAHDLPDCSSIEDIFLDFHLLQLCDASFVSHSGFGVLGAWNRPVPNQDMYVLTNQEYLKQNYWDRSNLSFYKVENLDDFLFI